MFEIERTDSQYSSYENDLTENSLHIIASSIVEWLYWWWTKLKYDGLPCLFDMSPQKMTSNHTNIIIFVYIHICVYIDVYDKFQNLSQVIL